MEATRTGPRWISEAEARRRAGMTRYRIRAILAAGLLTTREIPGMPREVLAEDIEKLETAYVRRGSVS